MQKRMRTGRNQDSLKKIVVAILIVMTLVGYDLVVTLCNDTKTVIT